MRVRKFRMISVIAPVRISSYDGPSVVLGSSIGIVGDDGVVVVVVVMKT